jgi:hypothetical protein
VRKLEDGLEVAVLDQALRALPVERRDRCREADLRDTVAELQCDRERVRSTTGVSGGDEPFQL